jgi:hypothetical protein
MNPGGIWRGLGILFVGALASASACPSLTQKAESNTLAAATLLATPNFNLVIAFDGGTLDAGTIPGEVVTGLFFGQRNPDDLSAPPTGLAGAGVSVQFTAMSLALGDQTGGKYYLDSTQNSQLVYTVGAVYSFQMAYQGQTYVGSVTAPPQETIPQFHPTPYAPITLAANSPLTITRNPPPAGGSLLPAFTVVFPLDASGNEQSPTYTNVPSTPLALLSFVVDDSQWTQQTVNIPGSAFPQPGSNYLVSVTAVQLGNQSQFSSNLFLGSAFVAGTADVGLVQTN